MKYLLFVAASFLCTSCVTTRELALFQASTTDSLAVEAMKPYLPNIANGDIIAIQVNSLSPEAASFFNPYAPFQALNQQAVGTAATTQPLSYASGYLVDTNGNIELPLIGKVAVKGLTNAGASDLIRSKLANYLKDPTVNVRNLSFRVSVLGEVANPSLFTVPNERITLIEALSLAGDVTLYGRRDNVLIIRESGSQKIFARLDLRNRDVFKSPYYYLHPNDVVYVEPNKARAVDTDRTFRFTPIIISALSFFAIIAVQLTR